MVEIHVSVTDRGSVTPDRPRGSPATFGTTTRTGRCGACSPDSAQALVAAPSALPLEHALAAAQRFPGLARAQHRQLLTVSPTEMVTTGVTSATPDSITLHLEGTIGGVPYNLDLVFTLDLANHQLVVTLKMTQPIPYEGSWTFTLHSLSFTGEPRSGEAPAVYTGASLVSASLPNLGGVIGAIIKCLGPQVIGIVLECLPSLVTGKQAFLACVIQQAEAALPNVVQCIQQNS